MKTLVATLVFLFIAIASFSQQTYSRADYEQKTIYEYGSRYMLDGKYLTAKELQVSLKRFEPSDIEYHVSVRNARVSGYLMLTTLACCITALTQYDKNPQLATGFLITGLATNIVAIPFGSKARKHKQKAVWLYNRDALAL